MEKKVITKAMQKAFVKEYLQTQIFIYMRNEQKQNLLTSKRDGVMGVDKKYNTIESKR